MGIPVYWAIPIPSHSETHLKPSWKVTQPTSSSIRRHPLTRTHRALYSDVVRSSDLSPLPNSSPVDRSSRRRIHDQQILNLINATTATTSTNPDPERTDTFWSSVINRMEDPTHHHHHHHDHQQIEHPLSSDDEIDLHAVRMNSRNEHDQQNSDLMPVYQDDSDSSSEGETEDLLPPLVQRSPEPIPSPVDFEGLPPTAANTVPQSEYLHRQQQEYQRQLQLLRPREGFLSASVSQTEDSSQDRHEWIAPPTPTREQYLAQLMMLESQNVLRTDLPVLRGGWLEVEEE